MGSTDLPGDSASDPDSALARILTEFEGEIRDGHVPSVEVWAGRYPEHADVIRELFPGVLLMEHAASSLRAHEDVEDFPKEIGPYEIKRVLGRGGMGTVYLAWDSKIGRHVALKVLHSSWQPSSKFVDRFMREVKAAGGLRHPNIVPVFGSGHVGGVPYYAMQYVQGYGLDECIGSLTRSPSSGTKRWEASDVSSLVALMNERGEKVEAGTDSAPGMETKGVALSWSEITRIGREVGSAIGHAHAAGVLHRDIKPANILLDSDGHAWVSDFGLCQLEGETSMTQDGDVVGTLRYMSPEQLEGEPNESSDVYGLGLVMYELLTRRFAFPETKRARLVRNILTSDPIRPRRLDPSIPRDLENIVLKATAKNQGERYPNALAFVRDLEAFDGGRAVQARPPSPFYLLSLFVRRQRALTTTIVVGALILGWLVALYTHRLRQEHDRSEYGEYSARLAAAESGLSDGSLSRAETQLLAAPVPFRGWEWYHLKARLRQSLQGLGTSLHYVRDVDFSPDGTFLIAAAEGGTYLYQLVDGGYREVFRWEGNAYACIFAKDGSAAYSANREGVVHRFALDGTFTETTVGMTTFEPNSLQITQQGRLVAGALSGKVVSLDPQTQQSRLLTDRGSPITGLKFIEGLGVQVADSRGWLGVLDPDGQLSTTGNLGLRQPKKVIWDPLDSQMIAIDIQGTLRGRSWPSLLVSDTEFGGVSGMTAAQFSSDGRFLAAGGGHGGLHLWDTGSGQYLGHHAGTPGRIMSCDWRADGGRIATGDDLGFVHLWHPRFSGGYLHLGRHWGDVGAFDAYGSGDSAVSASRDGSVIIWDVAHAEARRFIADPTSAVMDVKVLPGESSVVALCGSTELMAWDLESTQLLLHDITETPARNRVRGIVMDPDQDRFFIGLRAQEGHSKGGLEVWSASTLERLRILEVGDEALSVLGAPASVEFLVAGTEAGHLLILHPETGAILERIPLPEGVGTIRGVDVSADGRWVLANDWQAKMYLVNVEARRLERVLSLDEDIIHCAVFAQGGKRVIAGTRGGQIGVWDPATGQHLSNIDVLKHWIVALFFDGATDRLFVGGAEGSVEVYDLMSAQERMRRSEAAPTRGEDTLALRYDSEFSAHAVETAWRGLLDGSPGGFDSAERMLFFLSRGTYHEAAVAGLKGAIQLARGDREGAQRQLQFALQSEALGEKRKSELRTLLVLASLGTGSPWSPEPDAGPIDGRFLERWKRTFEDRSSK